MAGPVTSGAGVTATHNPATRYGPALGLLASLFFMWGFITVINGTRPLQPGVVDTSWTIGATALADAGHHEDDWEEPPKRRDWKGAFKNFPSEKWANVEL